MRYVQRLPGSPNTIISDYGVPQPGIAEEAMSENDPEYIAYKNPPPPDADTLEQFCKDWLNPALPVPPKFDLRKAFIAHAISVECYRLGINPNAITGPQLSALRNRVAAIYKAL